MKTIKPKFIEKNTTQYPAENFDLLVQQGINLLQKITGDKWTDYNIHDPGITILEQLCFAFTDLAYRTGFNIEQILTEENGYIDEEKNSFFNKNKILTTHPITKNDYRKVLLDEVNEIINIDLIPVKSEYSNDYVKGLYKIFIKVKDNIESKFKAQPFLEEEIIKKVRNSFLSNRNICEDLVRKIIILKPKEIGIDAYIIIDENYNPEELLVTIYHKIQNLFSPKTRFYSEKELVDRNMRVEEIFSGPLLKNGFIPDFELKPLKTYFHKDNLINEILKIKGVLFVKNLVFKIDEANKHEDAFDLESLFYPFINSVDFAKTVKLSSTNRDIIVNESSFKVVLKNKDKIKEWQHDIATVLKNEHKEKREFKNTGKYYSIQNNFPLIYGIGNEGLSSNENNSRKAKAKQLKAYLFFFEQVLANYTKQLQEVSNFFSTKLNSEKEGRYSYYPLYDIPSVKEILKPLASQEEWRQFVENKNNAYLQVLKNSQETNEHFYERKHKIFDHLYARFNQEFITYPIDLYYELFIENKNISNSDFVLKWKAEMLKKLPEIEYNKTKGFNYYSIEHELSGFEKKIFNLLNISNSLKKNYSSIFDSVKIEFVLEKEHNHLSKIDTNLVKKKDLIDEDIDIIDSEDEIIKMSKEDMLYDRGLNQNNSYIFRNQGISILRYGINVKNYRIGPSINNKEGYIIIYKNPDETAWRIISKHINKETAVLSLKKLIKFLRNISIESEGFHVIEHLLLRPDLDKKVFSYSFFEKHIDEANDKINIEKHNWCTFEERENDIAKNIKNDNGIFIKNKTNFYPRFEMLVALSNGQVIKEDFYNLRLTVVFPSWPARFQDTDFRKFIENLFKTLSPAYLKINFMWLKPSPMKEFEEEYFRWLDSLKGGASYEERNKLSEKIYNLIDKENTFLKS